MQAAVPLVEPVDDLAEILDGESGAHDEFGRTIDITPDAAGDGLTVLTRDGGSIINGVIEPGDRIGDVNVEDDAGKRRVKIGELDAGSRRRAARLVLRRIAGEHLFRVFMQSEKRQGCLQMRNGRGSDADLVAQGSFQKRILRRQEPGRRPRGGERGLHGIRRRAHVVAVQPLSGAHVEFRVEPWAQDEAGLRAERPL